MNYKSVLIALLFAVPLLLDSCSKYEEGPMFSLKTKLKRLEGEWKVISVDGKTISHNESYEFDSDNDARYFNESLDGWYTPDKGKWKWEDKKKNLSLVWDKNGTYEIQIKKLSNDEFWFDDKNNKLVKCEKQ